MPALEQADAEDLVERAHERCPYSNATRGNIEVARVVHGGAPVVGLTRHPTNPSRPEDPMQASERDDFGESDLGHAQSDNPPDDPDMI